MIINALLTEREVKIAKLFFCVFFLRVSGDVRVKRGCQKPLAKRSTEVKYTNLWHLFGSVLVSKVRSKCGKLGYSGLAVEQA